MQKISRLIYKTDTKEEFLPGYSEKFPHISSYVELDRYVEGVVPWHWHNALELFYVESGCVECVTPGGRMEFKQGTGALVNSNVMHMTIVPDQQDENIQLVHLFDPMLLAGEKGSAIEEKYIRPLVENTDLEIIPLTLHTREERKVIDLLRASFALKEEEMGYEMKLRSALSDIWIGMMEIHHKRPVKAEHGTKSFEKVKQLMVYVQEHYTEKISIGRMAKELFISERVCYRIFKECMNMTPTDYITNYRLQMACQMLLNEEKAVTEIAHSCGLGSSSYFGKIFREKMGCTPLEYRRKWQNNAR